MHDRHKIAFTASLIADTARAAMLLALLSGQTMSAGELAQAAGVSAQTASSHLGKLLAAGLVAVEARGRHRYYRLAEAGVAAAIEKIAAISSNGDPGAKLLSSQTRDLRFARCCYDHLAGRLGVAVTRALERRQLLIPVGDRLFDLTPRGIEWFDRLGLQMTRLEAATEGFASRCLDSTERRHHLAGPLGVGLLNLLCAKGWLRRSRASTALRVTPKGWNGLRESLGIDERSCRGGEPV